MSCRFGVLTVSTTCSTKENVDTSGPYLVENLKKLVPDAKMYYKVVPDNFEQIKESLMSWALRDNLHLAITTGGTGFSSSDVTPEVTKSIINKEAPGIATALMVKSLEKTEFAMLSRLVCGITNKTLIINFPGSLKAVQECFDIVKPVLLHAIKLIWGNEFTSRMIHSSEPITKNPVNHVCPHKSSHDVEKIVYRPRESPYPMIDVDEALSIVMEKMKDLPQTETLNSYENSFGHILAADVIASEDFPPFRASVKDGYACLVSDGIGIRKVIKGITAGDSNEVQISSGFCVRINTGAPVPPSADCVVQVEDTKLLKHSDDGTEEYEIEIMVPPKQGQDIRPIGCDIQQGEIVMKKGSYIGPAEYAVLTSVNAKNIQVYKKTTIGLMSTGNELVEAGQITTGCKIRDSNKPMLKHLLSEYKIDCIDLGIVKDDADATRQAFESAFEKTDFIVTTGSVSMGERDMLKPVLIKDFNADILFGRLNMKPGKPTTFATCLYKGKRKFVFALPGNPVSAFVTCHLIVIPAMKCVMGYNKFHSTEIVVELGEDVNLDPRPEYARGTISKIGSSGFNVVQITGNQMSSRLISTCNASVLVALPSSLKSGPILKKGSTVKALVIGIV